MHDLSLAGQYADRLIMLDRGRVVADGIPHEVLTEDTIAGCYQADVRILHIDGDIFVLPRRIMTALMVQGVSSSAGKSLVTTALARALRRRGVDVVPFKAMNMSNNARVVAGGEIGTAQYLQAVAAGVEPDVRMNPVLVKPEGDARSQVVVLGRARLQALGPALARPFVPPVAAGCSRPRGAPRKSTSWS